MNSEQIKAITFYHVTDTQHLQNTETGKEGRKYNTIMLKKVPIETNARASVTRTKLGISSSQKESETLHLKKSTLHQ